MSFVRNVISDLLEKKLWPVALILVGALVAIPVALGGSSDGGTPVVAPGAAATAANATPGSRAAVSVDVDVPGRTDRAGDVRNPFKQRKGAAAAADTAQATAKAQDDKAKDSAGSGGSGKGDSGTTGDTKRTDTDSDGGTGTSTPAKKKADPADIYRVAVRFGEAGDQKLRRDVARLTPMPSSTDPFFIFMGVMDDGKTAVFLVSSDAVATGDGTCRPSKTSCETVEMEVGDTQFFDLSTGTAGVVQYQLDLVSIKTRTASSAKSAAAARRRESRAGREYLRALLASDSPEADTLQSYDIDRSLGLLTRVSGDDEQPLGATGKAHVPSEALRPLTGDGGA